MMIVALVSSVKYDLFKKLLLIFLQINFLLYGTSIIIIVVNGGGTHLKKLDLLRTAINVRGWR